ncbi:unnamed protein product [Brachionus calyciflorus]|uniref:Uncharacterized protein n=1 Tax=Brachionus calyciflorus TaxID=104777 RepID=A0A814F8E4_9BILA|nr:unnamed protein product [Brachionus calyciflorus]
MNNSNIRERIEKLEKLENDQVNENKPSWAEAVAKPGQPPVSEKQMDMCISIMIDGKDRERRSKNVLIFGIEQSERVAIRDRYVEDREKVDKIFSDLRIQSDKKCSIKRFREKPNSTYIPPILIELQSERDRTTVLSVAKQLRGYPQYSNVYINPDLTDTERKLDKELRIQIDIRNDEERAN